MFKEEDLIYKDPIREVYMDEKKLYQSKAEERERLWNTN